MEKSSYMKQILDLKVKVSSDLAAAGFSWPPRNYVCTFCKREFRSAQALGGHMNVHRRDRARLRQSPTRDNNDSHNFSLLKPNPSLSPNPSFVPSSSPPPPAPLSSSKFPQFTSKFPPPSDVWKCGGDAVPVIQYGRPVTVDLMKLRASKGARGVEPWFKSTSSVRKNPEFVSLELEMGLISRSPAKEELDLELRLGCN